MYLRSTHSSGRPDSDSTLANANPLTTTTADVIQQHNYSMNELDAEISKELNWITQDAQLANGDLREKGSTLLHAQNSRFGAVFQSLLEIEGLTPKMKREEFCPAVHSLGTVVSMIRRIVSKLMHQHTNEWPSLQSHISALHADIDQVISKHQRSSILNHNVDAAATWGVVVHNRTSAGLDSSGGVLNPKLKKDRAIYKETLAFGEFSYEESHSSLEVALKVVDLENAYSTSKFWICDQCQKVTSDPFTDHNAYWHANVTCVDSKDKIHFTLEYLLSVARLSSFPAVTAYMLDSPLFEEANKAYQDPKIGHHWRRFASILDAEICSLPVVKSYVYRVTLRLIPVGLYTAGSVVEWIQPSVAISSAKTARGLLNPIPQPNGTVFVINSRTARRVPLLLLSDTLKTDNKDEVIFRAGTKFRVCPSGADAKFRRILEESFGCDLASVSIVVLDELSPENWNCVATFLQKEEVLANSQFLQWIGNFSSSSSAKLMHHNNNSVDDVVENSCSSGGNSSSNSCNNNLMKVKFLPFLQKNGTTILHSAVKLTSGGSGLMISLVLSFLRYSASNVLDTLDSNGLTALAVALTSLTNGAAAIVLLEAGASHDCLQFFSQELLIAAIDHSGNATELINEAFKLGADVNNKINGVTALHRAVIRGDGEIVRLLLKRNADMNILSDDGLSVVHFAVMHDSANALQIIFENGISKSKCEGAVHLAAQYNSIKCIQIFHREQMSLNDLKIVPNCCGNEENDNSNDDCKSTSSSINATPVMVATMMKNDGGNNGSSVQALRSLLACQCDPNVRCLASGSSIDGFKKGTFTTPIHTAAANNNIPCLIALIDAKAQINCSLENGSTPLFVASENGHLQSVKLLVSSGASLNACRLDGTTALCIAAKNGYAELIAELMRAQADPSLRGEGGMTPFQWANEKNHVDAALLLSSLLDSSSS